MKQQHKEHILTLSLTMALNEFLKQTEYYDDEAKDTALKLYRIAENGIMTLYSRLKICELKEMQERIDRVKIVHDDQKVLFHAYTSLCLIRILEQVKKIKNKSQKVLFKSLISPMLKLDTLFCDISTEQENIECARLGEIMADAISQSLNF